MKLWVVLVSVIILAGALFIRFLPFLVVAYIIVHFISKWW